MPGQIPTHEYTPQQALDLLMRKLVAGNRDLATHIQAAIDAGKDISEIERTTDRRKKPRRYRKTVPFSHEEALQVALDALQAYFVEQPLFVSSASEELAKTPLGSVQPGPDGDLFMPPSGISPGPQASSPPQEEPETVIRTQAGEEKRIEIELRTETQITSSTDETLRLIQMPQDAIEAQRENIRHLRELIRFQPEA
jgi:hypothetical protein